MKPTAEATPPDATKVPSSVKRARIARGEADAWLALARLRAIVACNARARRMPR